MRIARRGKSVRRKMKKDTLEIPEFLKISAEERKAAWKGREHTNPFIGGTDEAWRAREKERRAAIEDARKTKNARGLAKIKQAHPGERWDRKHKIWVPE
jgi:hypothetical protein